MFYYSLRIRIKFLSKQNLNFVKSQERCLKINFIIKITTIPYGGKTLILNRFLSFKLSGLLKLGSFGGQNQVCFGNKLFWDLNKLKNIWKNQQQKWVHCVLQYIDIKEESWEWFGMTIKIPDWSEGGRGWNIIHVSSPHSWGKRGFYSFLPPPSDYTLSQYWPEGAEVGI